MKTTDILIIGGGPAGIISATTAKSNYPNKKVTLVRENIDVLVPCAIPYTFGTLLPNTEKDLVPSGALQKSGVEVIIDTIVKIDIEKREALTEDGVIQFQKLIFATGSKPNTPNIIGANAKGVFTVPKDRTKIDNLKAHLDIVKSENVVVIGTGFIGVEIAGELVKTGKKVSLVGNSKRVLKGAFDDEFSEKIEDELKNLGVLILNSTKVKEILTSENGETTGVKFKNGEILEAGTVILAIGYSPNSELAKNSGIRVGIKGGIWVDEYMRTDFDGVFAVGDCVEKKSFLTRNLSKVMLASTATAEARIAGSSLYNLKYIKGFNGTISTFSTVMGELSFSSVGIIEQEANLEKFDYLVGEFEGVDKHPATLPNTHKQRVKIIAMRRTGTIIGGQVMGGIGSGELINLIALMVENKMSVYSIVNLQVATHPLLTASPTTYPIIKSAEEIVKKIDNCFIS
jgi:NADPH-dependent 2,4-dienoyl-CoA reductase/sulfur reductase-like enzyme